MFTADHGEQLGDHRLIGKLGFFDQSYHIPLIVRDPRKISDATRGSTLPASVFTEAVDVAPTILDACGVKNVPEQFQGQSLIRLLSGELHTWNRGAVHWEVDWRWWVIEGGSVYPELFQGLCDQYAILPDERWFLVHRTHRWKLVVFPKMEPLLFDMQDVKSVGESVNVANNIQYWDVLAALFAVEDEAFGE